MPDFRTAARRARTCGSASHAFIALHQAVDALARLTGERFTQLFARLELAHGFSRQYRGRWPDLAQIRAAAEQLELERAEWLARRDALIAQRRAEKRAGRRVGGGELAELEARARPSPRVGCWGWARRDGRG